MSQPRHYQFWPEHLPKTIEATSNSVHSNLINAAAKNPDKAATIFFGEELSYSKMLSQVEAITGYLQQACNVQKGDRVVLMMQNCPQFIIAFNAILNAGAIVIPINPMNVTDEIRHYINDSGSVCAIISQENTGKAIPLLDETPLKNIISATYSDYLPQKSQYEIDPVFTEATSTFDCDNVVSWQEVLTANLPVTQVNVSGDDDCMIIYTSGSTGAPKGCLHTHFSANSTINNAGLWTETSESSVALAVVPFFHVTGLQLVVNMTINKGGTVVILPRWNAKSAATMIEQHQCSHWINVPVMVIDMVNNPRAMERDISSLKFIMGGGSAMPEAVAAKLHELCGIEYVEGYGLSETAAGGIVNPTTRPKRGCLGIPWINSKALIVDPETLEILESGEAGEIIINSPQVFKSYWKNEAATKDTLIQLHGDTWLRTGDLGYMDEDGYFFITDRIKRMINAAGYKVWPAEVEAAFYKNEAIQEVCIISSPEERRGETVKAVVVLKADAVGSVSQEEIIAWAREHLSAYKVPRTVEFVQALPRTATGKVNWRSLQEAEYK